MSFNLKVGRSILLIFIIFHALSAHSEDYILNVYEPRPIIPFATGMDSKMRSIPTQCKEALIDKTQIQVTHISNFSVDAKTLKRDDTTRGLKIEGRQMSEYSQFVNPVLNRILQDWMVNHNFTVEQIDALWKLNERLPQHRTKFLTFKSVDNQKFSGMRIYDSSPVMKYRGWDWKIRTEQNDTQEISEMVFPNFSIDKFFGMNGIKRQHHTWSLGLLDISGKQDKALQTLMAQAADLLDLHYNKRNFYTLNDLSIIEKDDVDIIFYANSRLAKFYERVLGIKPLKDISGKELELKPRQSSGSEQIFYLFHIKGSDFIKQFFKLELHEPLFSSNLSLRKQKEVHQHLQSRLMPAYQKLNPKDFIAKDFGDLFFKLITNYNPQPKSEDEFYNMAAKYIMLRQQNDLSVLSEWNNPKWLRSVGDIAYRLAPSPQLHDGPDPRLASTITLIQFIYAYWLNDPMQFLVNRTHLNN